MKILIVYEEVPESTSFYVVDMTEEEFQRYSKVAGMLVNSDEFTAEEQLIADEIGLRVTKGYLDQPPGDWSEFNVTSQELLTTAVDGVLFTGFVL